MPQSFERNTFPGLPVASLELGNSSTPLCRAARNIQIATAFSRQRDLLSAHCLPELISCPVVSDIN